MLEQCSNILECEEKLVSSLRNIHLLGEITLSSDDRSKLGYLISRCIFNDVNESIRFLKNNAQVSLSCFLVWKGILDYHEGDFWSSIEVDTGISDPNWQSRMGEIFVCCLKNYNFPIFEIKDAHRYVSNILIHGMIPNSCLNEYFSKVLYPLVIKELISCDFKEISFLIQKWRECEVKKLEIEDHLYLLNSI